MFRLISALFAGSLFGLGLIVSDMLNADRVQGWLDVLGNWDPTLAFVLGGAILPMLLAWPLSTRRGKALLGNVLPGPASVRIDWELFFGAALFGAGWALVGLCPGPAVAGLGLNGISGILFFLTMIMGMSLTPYLRRHFQKPAMA
ncbi:hypothetical protein A6M27_14795 [Acidithiobacillus thiooxidans]|uniref:YeeE/YedE family protein n=1 Tax=Acidithiobacillus thiooxidans TaxID=930 RepID=A0A1C2JBK0_ACITH|nr:DUF6691 family protein [Acidithiobacillus thiooxidans]OCX69205.1 hypothetical protein A6P07_16945 [Acidithiobacillus thiooxidans]OCX79981.1 hypothetical protein A6O24_00535 [Acidithiobacillus thiooxidans]OCX85629.1 hypothetical protein A6M27_14795 [Acidithiobacillus thiooxidans]OCX85740.1 hypothetical protein A6O26_00565 [Acidithiobacillus thiooxidans]OFC43253.1 hypothetical protein BAE47_13270 [Acidithiobacillus thiooxidans]